MASQISQKIKGRIIDNDAINTGKIAGSIL